MKIIQVLIIYLFTIINPNTIIEPDYIVWTNSQGYITNIECNSAKFCNVYHIK